MPILLRLLSLLALGFVFTASDCHNELVFTPAPNREVCTDNLDNDGDGRADCWDSDCSAATKCQVEITLNPVTSPNGIDTLALSGTCQNAARIDVTLAPVTAGQAGQALITGSTWSLTLRNLLIGNATLTAVATDSTGLFLDSVSENFTVSGP